MTGHAHHWRIDEPRGRTSEGVCLDCGVTRTFGNYEPADRWDHPSRKRWAKGLKSIQEKRWTTKGDYVR